MFPVSKSSYFTWSEFAKHIFYAAKVIKVQFIYFTDILCSKILISRNRYESPSYTISLFNKKSLTRHKKSDTLFILASGFSLNTLSDYQWKIIQSCDVLTFNHSYMLNVNPTYYLCELADYTIMSKIGSDLYSISEYHDVPKFFTPDSPNILKAISRFNKISFSNSIFTPVIWFPSCNYKHFREQFWRLLNFSRFLSVSYPSVQTIFRASLDRAIGLGIQLNYKDIVLLGADLNTKYFFEDSKLLRSDLVPPHKKKKTPGIHATIRDPDHKLTMIDVVKELIEFCRKKTSTNLFYRGTNLELSALLPDYHW